MPYINLEQNAGSSAPPSGEVQTSNVLPPIERLQRFGKNVLAVAGVTIALLAARAVEAPTANGAGNPVGPPNPVPTVPAQPFETGISAYNSHTDDPDHLYSDMHAIGMTCIREAVSIESTQTDMSVLRSDMARADVNGIEVVVNLGENRNGPLAGYPEWAASVAAQLPHVKRFIIDNEVNSPLFWDHTMKQYVNVLHQTAEDIHAVRPDAQVSGFGLASGYNPVGYLKHAAQYAKKRFGGLQNIEDTLSAHLYRRPLADERLVRQEQEIWPWEMNIDEYGNVVRNSGQSNPTPYGVTKIQQADDEIRFLTWAETDPQIQDVLNYRMEDSTDPTDLKTGLITSTGDKLLSYYYMDQFNQGGSTRPRVSPRH